MSESKIPASNGQYKPLHLPLHLIDENLTLAEVYGPMRVGEPWPLPPRTAITPQPADTATQPPRRSRERERARVHRHTVKRQIEVSLTLPHIQKHGFTHPSNGHFLMLPPEYDVIQALEKKAVASVVLAVLRRTMGAPGDGPYGRKEWVQLSTHALADATLMAHGAARRGITEAVTKGYLLRRRAGRSYEYAIRWRGTN